MAIRAFLSTWQRIEYPGGGGEIINPIVDHLANTEGDAIASMFYPDADANGIPDKPVLLVLVESATMPGVQLEALQNLPGVSLIPAFRGKKALSELPKPARDAITSILGAHSIPQSVMTNSVDIAGLLEKIMAHISPRHTGITKYLEKREHEFG